MSLTSSLVPGDWGGGQGGVAAGESLYSLYDSDLYIVYIIYLIRIPRDTVFVSVKILAITNAYSNISYVLDSLALN